jgi:para-aminobenzoate synthetase / 4-amino-4-deoxychorismate lyase
VTGSSTPRAIVDFPLEPARVAQRLTFTEPLGVWRADSIDRVVAVLDDAEHAAREGRWVVGFVTFEAAAAFDPAFERPQATSLPLAWFAEFAAPTTSTADDEGSMNAEWDGDPAELTAETAVSDVRYAEALQRIHTYIEAGDVYQVNLTVPFTARRVASPRAIYERMRRAQGGAYSCLIETGDACVLTASPELFFERRGDHVHSRPMKGTAPRGLYPAADAEARTRLVHSEKEHAENVMIVDVVRNDLGRIAETGTVRVDTLCHPERYPSVWQLTSTVGADLRRGVSLAEVFGALFPPASVTGAPKIRATSIIRELESGPREIYCGAVGLLRPGGDATFNVAIRTAWSLADGEVLRLNAGGGVTADSTVVGELREVHAKLAAFTQPIDPPALFETMRVEGGVVARLERHLSRLQASADYFAIPFDRASARRVLDEAIARSERSEVRRARLDLSPDGAMTALVRTHDPTLRPGGARVAFSPTPVDRGDVYLYHKCADRARYEAALASAPGMFDVLLWNGDREATELTRGNIVVELDGKRFTPPVDCGLLGGVLRGELLDRGDLAERVLTLDDVRAAERLWFVNSLRGLVPVTLVDRDPGAAD